MWSMPTASSARAPSQRITDALRGSVIVDLAAGGGDEVPLAAELVQPLAVRVAGLGVADVRIERVLGVGELPPAVCRADRSELRAGPAGPRLRLGLGGQRRPHAQAAAGALADVGLVALEEVERPTARVDQHATVAGSAYADGRRRGG